MVTLALPAHLYTVAIPAPTRIRGAARTASCLARLERGIRPHKQSQATGLNLHYGGLDIGDMQPTKHGFLGLLDPS